MTSETQSDLPGGGGFEKRSLTARNLPTELGRVVRNGPALVRATRAGRVPHQLAEKLMLATTAVNECRYCARFHTHLAREAGIDDSVIDDILERDVEAAIDPGERTALLFAQHYAETDGEPSSEAVDALVDEYGAEMAADIRAYVRAIHFGNLLGNTVDAVRYRTRATVGGWVERCPRIRTVSRSRE
ncbi:carboxymuconolactone decarboxylase family protein [Haloglomus litoreum]|uniref:carboxymuconolactone decarboxylase family protein n=1 Tax=Haloglomus litoreum TaxID=3034026 RepID=UPI0023E79D02|nr:carboxymuconolactone decarboxylase family protein [Haloglomus sp. DT116]